MGQSGDEGAIKLDALAANEVRVYTLDSGESSAVRDTARSIIGALLHVPASRIELFATAKGKPLLRNDSALHFSISHSRDVSMIALTRVAPVGVDIEKIRAVPNAEAILRRFFGENEIAEVLSDDRRDFRFIEAWTRAEARVKVRGASMWEAATPDASTTVRQLIAPDGFVAAIAVAANSWHATQHDLSITRCVAR
ncbi:MAG: 4'-phosphopantetheinyl transferase superfamily protein [Gemmatimonadota bacterium]|nr:4'-phosphopantetheinyl transferase superfamily protein [Gemmatimonadota bacterium]